MVYMLVTVKENFLSRTRELKSLCGIMVWLQWSMLMMMVTPRIIIQEEEEERIGVTFE